MNAVIPPRLASALVAALAGAVVIAPQLTSAQRIDGPLMTIVRELPHPTTSILALIVDRNGKIYAAGTTRSPSFPTTPDAFDRTCGNDGQCGATQDQSFHQPQEDAFVTRLAPDGTIEYSTFVGGDGRDHLTGFALGQDGSVYLTEEYSGGIGLPPPLVRPFVRACGRIDGFVAKLSRTGAALDFASCLSGVDIVSPTGIAVDGSGQAVIAGNAFTQDFPVLNALQPHGSPSSSGSTGGGPFVMKIAADGSRPLFSTYFGGSRFDVLTALALAPNGDIVIGGYTQSQDFPLVRPVQGALNGVLDAFIARIDAAGRIILHSTYLGGETIDEVVDVTVGADGDAWYVGDTHSAKFPVTPDAFHPACGNSAPCSLSRPAGFVAGFDPTGRYVSGTFIDTDESYLTRVRLGPRGQLYAIGGSSAFRAVTPLTSQRCTIGIGLCGFLTMLAPRGADVKFASNVSIDGRLSTAVTALAVGPQGEMYVAVPTAGGASILRIDHPYGRPLGPRMPVIRSGQAGAQPGMLEPR